MQVSAARGFVCAARPEVVVRAARRKVRGCIWISFEGLVLYFGIEVLDFSVALSADYSAFGEQRQRRMGKCLLVTDSTTAAHGSPSSIYKVPSHRDSRCR